MPLERSRREFLKQGAALTALSAATLWRPAAAQRADIRSLRALLQRPPGQ